MPNLDKLILTAAQYKFFIALANNFTDQLLTLDSVDMDISMEEELIYAVGDENAIGNKQNAKKVTGKFTIQTGELFSILDLNGMTDATQIRNATIACTTIVGSFQRTIRNLNINREATAVKRKDKETLATCDFTALLII